MCLIMHVFLLVEQVHDLYPHIFASLHPPEQPIAQHPQARIRQAPVHPEPVAYLGRREAFGILLE